MSADNGIVVLKSPKVFCQGCEYRVREVHALENLFARNDRHRLDTSVVGAAFGDCATFDHEGAQKAASALKREIALAGQIIEYGVIQLALREPFPVL